MTNFTSLRSTCPNCKEKGIARWKKFFHDFKQPIFCEKCFKKSYSDPLYLSLILSIILTFFYFKKYFPSEYGFVYYLVVIFAGMVILIFSPLRVVEVSGIRQMISMIIFFGSLAIFLIL